MANKSAAAKHLDLSTRQLRRHVEEKTLPPMPAGGYDLNALRTSYIRHLRKIAAGHSSHSGVDLVAERGRLAAVQRERAELDLQIRRGQYCEIELTGQMVEGLFAVVRERALSIPGKLADAISMQPRQACFELLVVEVNAMLGDLYAGSAEEIARRAAEEATG
jgi:phage terminase Nu1 subunit (DNA packaging protein)